MKCQHFCYTCNAMRQGQQPNGWAEQTSTAPMTDAAQAHAQKIAYDRGYNDGIRREREAIAVQAKQEYQLRQANLDGLKDSMRKVAEYLQSLARG